MEGRLVYFSGTPCQIAGLKSFLIRDYDNLITQDVICHGVPSPLVWQKYLEYKTKGLKPANVNFRDKSYSWENFAFRIDNKDNKLLPGMTAFVEINTQEKDNVKTLDNITLQYRPDDILMDKVIYPENKKLNNVLKKYFGQNHK